MNHEYPGFSITMTAFLCTPKGDADGFKKEDSNEEQKEAIINDVKEKFYIEGFALSANDRIG